MLVEKVKRYIAREKGRIPMMGYGHFFVGVLFQVMAVLGCRRVATYFNSIYSKKVVNYLEKNYLSCDTIDCLIAEAEDHGMIDTPTSSDKIWVFWGQGEKNMSEMIKACLNNLRRYSNGRDVVVLDIKNYSQYVSFPDYVVEKYKMGIIPIQQFSDLLRAALLYQYGGMWIDAGIFATENIPDTFFKSDFHSPKCTNIDSYHISQFRWCVTVMGGPKGNKIMSFLYATLLEYWHKEHALIDYFLTDYIIYLGYKHVPVIRKMLDRIPENNGDLFWFIEHADEKYDKCKMKEVMEHNFLFKLSLKKKLDRVRGSYGEKIVTLLLKNEKLS